MRAPPALRPAGTPTRAGLLFAAALILGLAGTPAWAQLVVVGSPDLTMSSLSKEKAAELFLGRRDTDDSGAAVGLVDLPPGPVRDRFYRALTGKNPSQIRAYWSRLVFTGRALPPREAASVDEARRWIAAGPHTIGYLPEGEAGKDVRILLRLP